MLIIQRSPCKRVHNKGRRINHLWTTIQAESFGSRVEDREFAPQVVVGWLLAAGTMHPPAARLCRSACHPSRCRGRCCRRCHYRRRRRQPSAPLFRSAESGSNPRSLGWRTTPRRSVDDHCEGYRDPRAIPPRRSSVVYPGGGGASGGGARDGLDSDPPSSLRDAPLATFRLYRSLYIALFSSWPLSSLLLLLSSRFVFPIFLPLIFLLRLH